MRPADSTTERERNGRGDAGLGPVFGTTSKQVGLAPLGVEMVREVTRHARIPVIGIAGINPENASEVISAGADGVAVISYICCAGDVTAAAADIARSIGIAL